jgi:amidase
MADLRQFDNDRTTLFFDPEAEPIAEIADGERFVVRTRDSICGLWRSHVPSGLHIDEVLEQLGGACPLTGPFAVTGAEPGTIIEVEIHRVDPFPRTGVGWTGVFGGFGALTSDIYNLQDPLGATLHEVPYTDTTAFLRLGERTIRFPMRPFLGTVGVAPRWERRMTFSQSPEYLGDVDLRSLTAGSIVRLPVNVEGALLSLGDAHAAQGQGEITGVGIEIEAEVELTVRVRDPHAFGYGHLPQLDTSTAIGSVAGMYGVHLGDCVRAAYADLARRLVAAHGFTRMEAYQLLGQVGRVEIGNMIDPFYSALASVERRFLDF